jgi:hypothetical protein
MHQIARDVDIIAAGCSLPFPFYALVFDPEYGDKTFLFDV